MLPYLSGIYSWAGDPPPAESIVLLSLMFSEPAALPDVRPSMTLSLILNYLLLAVSLGWFFWLPAPSLSSCFCLIVYRFLSVNLTGLISIYLALASLKVFAWMGALSL